MPFVAIPTQGLCRLWLTSQPVASDKLVIRTSGVLPIRPARPWAVAGHLETWGLPTERPATCRTESKT